MKDGKIAEHKINSMQEPKIKLHPCSCGMIHRFKNVMVCLLRRMHPLCGMTYLS
jgi:hypothetical protein